MRTPCPFSVLVCHNPRCWGSWHVCRLLQLLAAGGAPSHAVRNTPTNFLDEPSSWRSPRRRASSELLRRYTRSGSFLRRAAASLRSLAASGARRRPSSGVGPRVSKLGRRADHGRRPFQPSSVVGSARMASQRGLASKEPHWAPRRPELDVHHFGQRSEPSPTVEVGSREGYVGGGGEGARVVGGLLGGLGIRMRRFRGASASCVCGAAKTTCGVQATFRKPLAGQGGDE